MELTIKGKKVKVIRIAHLPEQKIIRVFLDKGGTIILEGNNYNPDDIIYDPKFIKKLQTKLDK